MAAELREGDIDDERTVYTLKCCEVIMKECQFRASNDCHIGVQAKSEVCAIFPRRKF